MKGAMGLFYVRQSLRMAEFRASASSLSARRNCSAKTWLDESSDVADSEGGSSSGSRGLDQVLREFRIQKAAPDWLPFLPGGSFWVPPEVRTVKDSIPVIEAATEGEIFAMIMPSGYPAPSTAEGTVFEPW